MNFSIHSPFQRDPLNRPDQEVSSQKDEHGRAQSHRYARLYR